MLQERSEGECGVGMYVVLVVVTGMGVRGIQEKCESHHTTLALRKMSVQR